MNIAVCNLRTDIETVNDHPKASAVLEQYDSHKYIVERGSYQSVDLSHVAGCFHPDYCHKTIGDLQPRRDIDGEGSYNQLKRAGHVLRDLDANPEYYLSGDIKHDWTFIQVGDDLYIGAGVHRTICALYFLHLNGLPLMVHGVYVSKATLRVDPELVLEREAPKQAGLVQKALSLIGSLLAK